VLLLLTHICDLLGHINPPSPHPSLVPLRVQVTCGTSLWESSSLIRQLSVIEEEADSKHSCSSAGIVTLASADMSAHFAA